jgi:hypothetical protein
MIFRSIKVDGSRSRPCRIESKKVSRLGTANRYFGDATGSGKAEKREGEMSTEKIQTQNTKLYATCLYAAQRSAFLWSIAVASK